MMLKTLLVLDDYDAGRLNNGLRERERWPRPDQTPNQRLVLIRVHRRVAKPRPGRLVPRKAG